MAFHADPRLYTLEQVFVSIAALLATLGGAAFSWRVFEKPLIRMGHEYSYEESRGGAASVAFENKAINED
jgi:peptidoglycan/LPS O-acetylase OafA/YrhL